MTQFVHFFHPGHLHTSEIIVINFFLKPFRSGHSDYSGQCGSAIVPEIVPQVSGLNASLSYAIRQ